MIITIGFRVSGFSVQDLKLQGLGFVEGLGFA